MRVADGIFKVDGMRVANAWLIETTDGLMLVDGGMAANARRIFAAIEAAGHRTPELRRIVLTHDHVDHVGGVARLKDATGAQVAIHELDAPILAGEQMPRKASRATSLIYRAVSFRPVRPDVLLRDGDEIGGFRVMHVPGHTAGSIVLHRDDGVVLSGDALLSDRHGRVLPPNPRFALDREMAAASAERIRALRFSLLLPGHGAPVHA